MTTRIVWGEPLQLINCDNPRCNKEFFRSKLMLSRRKNNFCSNNCKFEFLRLRMEKVKRKRHAPPLVHKVNKECAYCSKKIEVFPCHAKQYTNHFCNNKCRNNFRKDNNKQYRNKTPVVT